MVDKDRYNIKKLPVGMTHIIIRSEMGKAYALLQKSGSMTKDMETAFRYAGRLIIDAELEDFHSCIPQKPIT